MDYAHSELWQPAYHSPQATFARHRLPAQGSYWTQNLYRMDRLSRGPVPNASKRQIGSVKLGSPGPLFVKAAQGSKSEPCLGGWRCSSPREEVDRRRLQGTASRKPLRPSGQSRAKGRKWVTFEVLVKDGRGSMAAAKNMSVWHRGVQRGAEADDNAWRRADLRQSNVRR